MDEREEVLSKIDGKIADLKMEGLVETASIVSRLKSAIAGSPVSEVEVLGIIANAFEELERRIVAVESLDR